MSEIVLHTQIPGLASMHRSF